MRILETVLLAVVALPASRCFLPFDDDATMYGVPSSVPATAKAKAKAKATSDDDALYVTPYLGSEANRSLARNKASVKDLVGGGRDVESYAGYFTVDRSHNSNLFFWFFPCAKEPQSAPLVVWLQGGPGYSSLMALFHENGPYRVVGDAIELRDTSWTKRFNVLYVDNPVGAGYSFTDHSDGYSRTVGHAALNLYEALDQFYTLFDRFRNNSLVLAGQSYAGKYIPSLAKLIDERNARTRDDGSGRTDGRPEVNLKGLFVGCGYIDPSNQIRYADYLYENGVVDAVAKQTIAYREREARAASQTNRYYRATYHLALIAAKIRSAGYTSLVDVTRPAYQVPQSEATVAFVRKAETRAAIHVGRNAFNDGATAVRWYFRGDFYNSVSDELSAALNRYAVLLYTGQFDMVVPPSQIDAVVESLSWSESTNFRNAAYNVWLVRNETAGYLKTYSNLTQVMVRNANHHVIGTQPAYLYDLIARFCHKL